MTAQDLFRIWLPALLGMSLLARSAFRAHADGYFKRVPDRYRTIHERLTGRLIRRGLFRIPGIRLVDPVRPWAVSELLFLLVVPVGIAASPTFAGAVESACIATLLCVGVLWIRFRGAARDAIRSVRRDLPVACFLLSLLLESGMGASSALQETAGSIPRGTLARELGELVRSRSMGVPRGEAISRSREKLPLEEYRLFLNYVSQGERLGIGLSRSLRELSSKMLESMGHRAETVAQEAAVKMLFPLVFLMFPAVFLLILSPVLLGLRELLWG
ncbi:MAG: type II secretion system F family protein [Deltaproteobacteria bacterium]|nr:type II secretion system F family protein [Deltaproteobacteria bacterium]